MLISIHLMFNTSFPFPWAIMLEKIVRIGSMTKKKKKKICSVKSAYNLALTLHNVDEACTSSASPLWSLLWNLKVPKNVKLFKWLVSRDIHGTHSRLHSHGVKVSPKCPVVTL